MGFDRTKIATKHVAVKDIINCMVCSHVLRKLSRIPQNTSSKQLASWKNYSALQGFIKTVYVNKRYLTACFVLIVRWQLLYSRCRRYAVNVAFFDTLTQNVRESKSRDARTYCKTKCSVKPWLCRFKIVTNWQASTLWVWVTLVSFPFIEKINLLAHFEHDRSILAAICVRLDFYQVWQWVEKSLYKKDSK